MKPLFISASLGLLLGLVSIAAKADTTPPVLKPTVTISGATLSLADVMVGADLPTTPLFASPAAGQTGSIQASRIAEAARKAGYGKILGDLTGVVLVTRKGRAVSNEEIRQVLQQALATQGSVQNPDIVLDGKEQSPLFVADNDAAPPAVSALNIDRTAQRFSATLTGRSNAALPITFEGHFVEWVDVPVLTRTLDKNDRVMARDIKLERRERQSVLGLKLADPATAAGQSARALISAGAILTEDAISRPFLVEKSMAVTVNYVVGGLSLSLRGKAEEAGTYGDVISVLNTQSKKTLFATVTGPGVVTVNPQSPAKLASN